MTGVKKFKFGKVLISLREKTNNRKPKPFIETCQIVGMSNRHVKLLACRIDTIQKYIKKKSEKQNIQVPLGLHEK